MSLISLDEFITCTNKDLSWEVLFRSLIDVSSSGKTYFRTTDSIYAAADQYERDFVDADLATVVIGGISHEVLLVTHNFGTNSYDYVVKDNLGNGQIVSQSVIDTNSTYIIIDDTITGTWSISLWTV